jgi:hypothetical protein
MGSTQQSLIVPFAINPAIQSLTLERKDDFWSPRHLSTRSLSCSFSSGAISFCPLNREPKAIKIESDDFSSVHVVPVEQRIDLSANLTQSGELLCGEIQFYKLRIPDEYSVPLQGATIEVVQSDRSCNDSKSLEGCAMGVVFIGSDYCPTPSNYDFRQTFAKRALVRLTDPQPGQVFIIGVAADYFSGRYPKKTAIRNRNQDVPLAAVWCCNSTWEYHISVSFDTKSYTYGDFLLYTLIFSTPSILIFVCKVLDSFELSFCVMFRRKSETLPLPQIDSVQVEVDAGDANGIPAASQGCCMGMTTRRRVKPKSQFNQEEKTKANEAEAVVASSDERLRGLSATLGSMTENEMKRYERYKSKEHSSVVCPQGFSSIA